MDLKIEADEPRNYDFLVVNHNALDVFLEVQNQERWKEWRETFAYGGTVWAR